MPFEWPSRKLISSSATLFYFYINITHKKHYVTDFTTACGSCSNGIFYIEIFKAFLLMIITNNSEDVDSSVYYSEMDSRGKNFLT